VTTPPHESFHHEHTVEKAHKHVCPSCQSSFAKTNSFIDTLDLQDQHSPSAQDHTNQPTHPNPLGIGPAAPHQAAEVRHAIQEQKHEEERLKQAWTDTSNLRDSPTTESDEEDQARDELAIRQNGGMSGSNDDADMSDGDGEDSMDDDMMDKISSSPSIDDGRLPIFCVTSEETSRARCPDLYRIKSQKISAWDAASLGGDECSHTFGKEMPITLMSRFDHLIIPSFSLSSIHSVSPCRLPPAHSAFNFAFAWCSDCLQEVEDIDFEFVYALHTFVAVVEGQANVTKGETMVLLDDSNSYWWLVRILKDGSIGYLPAEHIETPTERLARLNKRRNGDLTASMLTDKGEGGDKSKNLLKKAMRRRNAKAVTFGSNTYVEASEYEYSTDEEDGEEMAIDKPQNGAEQQNEGDQDVEDSNMAPEPLKIGHPKESSSTGSNEQNASSGTLDTNTNKDTATEAEPRDSQDTSERKVSKNGTIRNTDSFFRDENVETRKITLTPNLLRDDTSSNSSTTRSFELKERGASLDSIEKQLTKDAKEDKRKKDKKPGMLSGLFKRKEKKGKGGDGSDRDDKSSFEGSRSSPQPKVSEDNPSGSGNASPVKQLQDQPQTEAPQRQLSRGKLQKPQKRSDKDKSTPPDSAQVSPKLSPPEDPPTPESEPEEVQAAASSGPTSNLAAGAGSSIAATSTRNDLAEQVSTNRTNPSSTSEPEHLYSDISADPNMSAPRGLSSLQPPTRDAPAPPPPQNARNPQSRTLLSSSSAPIQEAGGHISQPVPETTSESESRSGQTRWDGPSPEGVKDAMSVSYNQQGGPQNMQSKADSHSLDRSQPQSQILTQQQFAQSQSSTSSIPLNDAYLRAFFESSEVRDLLVLVSDASGSVSKLSKESPAVRGMFVEERRSLGRLRDDLDLLIRGRVGG
jgi:hypothetical protein